MKTEFPSPQPSPSAGGDACATGGEGIKAPAERVQAFDFYRDRKIFYYALYDPETGVVRQEAVKQESIVDGAIQFLQRAWTIDQPAVLAMDTASLGNVRRFKRFLADAGVSLRVRNPVDGPILGALERIFYPRVSL